MIFPKRKERKQHIVIRYMQTIRRLRRGMRYHKYILRPHRFDKNPSYVTFLQIKLGKLRQERWI
jgi:hypothetical protein